MNDDFDHKKQTIPNIGLYMYQEAVDNEVGSREHTLNSDKVISHTKTPSVYKSGFGFVEVGDKSCYDCPRCKLFRHKNTRDCIMKRRNER